MKNKGVLYLFAAAMLWGSAFIAQRQGMDHIGPYTYVFFRYVLSVVSSAVMVVTSIRKYGFHTHRFFRSARIGIITGLPLAIGMILQQVGLVNTPASKAGFLTAMYILIVPFLGLLRGKKIEINVWIVLVIAVVGFYFLCVTESFTIQASDLIILLGALGFSLQIDLIDRYGKEADSFVLTCFSQLTVLVVAFVLMVKTETVVMGNVMKAWIPIVYCGIFSGSIAEFLQVTGQKTTKPAVASLVLSLESVFSAIFGVLLLSERLSSRELIGCILVFASVLISQREKKD